MAAVARAYLPGTAGPPVAAAGRATLALCVFLPLLAASPVPAAPARWPVLALLAALYAVCARLARHPFLGAAADGPPGRGGGICLPVLLAAALLLPPAAAALVAVPGALLARPGERRTGRRRVRRIARTRRVERVRRTGRLAVATWAAAQAAALLDGPQAAGRPDFPYVLLPAGVSALVFWLVRTALDGPGTGRRRPSPGSPVPYVVHGLAGLMMAVLWRSPYGWPAALTVLLPVCLSCWAFAQCQRERAAHRATIRALVEAVELKDAYTRGHSERVGRASMLIARELGMDESRMEVLRFAGTLHDIGKLGVPTRVLRKDGPLTREERRIIEQHPHHGREIVRGIGFLDEASAAILHHHERVDGRGYPHGLKGEQIPEVARVVAVADAFDAMTSNRSYRRARPVAAAVAELERCAGSHFDPRMVRALARALERHGWPAPAGHGEPPAAPSRNVPPARPPARGAAPGPTRGGAR
ncbi:HD-GYP domain-containing protein [Streptomyces sp. HMX112]|uniref:HD-GYP domain-containing protein n=1 Tax=Streptomyces sp. HMX112 TaxID=3390850 RepID=UPI003A7F739E